MTIQHLCNYAVKSNSKYSTCAHFTYTLESNPKYKKLPLANFNWYVCGTLNKKLQLFNFNNCNGSHMKQLEIMTVTKTNPTNR